MPATNRKQPLLVLLALTTLPALLIGATLWFVAGLVPGCVITERQRLTAPDQQFDLVLFTRACGEDTEDNRQAALVPPGESLPEDAASFFAAATSAELAGQWIDSANLSITIPPGANIRRQDATVAGIAVTYR